MGELATTSKKVATIRDLFKRMEGQIAAVAPRHLTPERITRIAMTTIQRTPALADCSPESLLGCLLTCTQLGLEPDGVSGRAYLVPYRVKGTMTATLIPGYRGLKQLAEQHPKVKVVHLPQLVYDADEFDYELGLEPKLRHVPGAALGRADPGNIKAAYCIAELADGTKLFEVMFKHQIDAIRKRSRAGSDGPWVTDYGEMARKTVVKRLCKYLPSSAELDRAVAMDNAAEVGTPQDIDFIDIPAEPSAPPSDLDAVVQQEQAKAPTSLLPNDDIDLTVVQARKKVKVVLKQLGEKGGADFLKHRNMKPSDVDKMTDAIELNDLLIALEEARA